MKKQELTKGIGHRLDLYVTGSVAIIRQLGFWYDTKKVYQLVPTQGQGFVIAMLSGKPLGEKPLYAWVVNRPVSLLLTWEAEKTVIFHELDFTFAKALEIGYPDWFCTVGQQHGTTM